MESSQKKAHKTLSVHLDNLAVPEVKLKSSEDLDNDESEDISPEDINYQCAIPEVRSKRQPKNNN